jgi:hypothetical protein
LAIDRPPQEGVAMKVADLPGQFVWLDTENPILVATDPDAPDRVARSIVVRIDRVTEPTDSLPALAIWSDAEGEYGVEADLVADHVVSLPPAGDSPVVRTGDAIARRLGRRS